MEKISVIIPIYKVEEYLDRCVVSVVNQTYKNLEIILVDDGSPDNCPKICDEWAEKDNRIKVIHKENGGLSDARNAGMKVMTGEYVSFVDSDDWIHASFYEILMNVMKKENCDIVQCERSVLHEDKGEAHRPIKPYETDVYGTEKALELLLAENKLKQVVWNKLYKKETIMFDFPKGKLNEDEFWTYRVFGQAKKIAYIDVPVYYYFQREGSIINSKYSLRRLHAIEALVERHEYIKEYYPTLEKKSQFATYCACMYAYQMSIKYLEKADKKQACRYIKEVVNDYYPDKEIMKDKSFMMKVWVNCSKISFDMTCRLRCMLNIGF